MRGPAFWFALGFWLGVAALAALLLIVPANAAVTCADVRRAVKTWPAERIEQVKAMLTAEQIAAARACLRRHKTKRG